MEFFCQKILPNKVFALVFLLIAFVHPVSAQEQPAQPDPLDPCTVSDRDGEIFKESAKSASIFSWMQPIKKQVVLSSQYLQAKNESGELQKLELLCKSMDEVDAITYKVVDENYESKKKEASVRLYQTIYACSIPLLSAMKQESAGCEEKQKYLRYDIENLTNLVDSTPKAIELINTGVNPEEPVKNFSNEQIKKLIDSGNLSGVASEEPYYSVLLLGATIMPKYNKDGNNEGFQETSFFGMLKLENRWPWSRYVVNHMGIDAAFYSAPVRKCEAQSENPNPAPAPDPVPAPVEQKETTCDEKEKDISTLKFNDISNTLNASLYFNILFNMPGKWELGPSLRYGVVSREKIAGNGDSISGYYLIGVELALNDFLDNPKVKYLSGLPRFSFNLAAGENEDFAGLGIRSTRYVTSVNYRVYENQPIFVSLLLNDGEGPDTVALNLSYGLVASEILGVFSR